MSLYPQDIHRQGEGVSCETKPRKPIPTAVAGPGRASEASRPVLGATLQCGPQDKNREPPKAVSKEGTTEREGQPPAVADPPSNSERWMQDVLMHDDILKLGPERFLIDDREQSVAWHRA